MVRRLRKGEYIVTRTSSRGNGSPVPGAKKVTLLQTEKVATIDHRWLEFGTNHRQYKSNGLHARDVIDAVWVVKVPDLWKFVAANGDCVISIDAYGQRNIEIYDDYRE